MIWNILGGILGDVWPYIAAGVAGLLALWRAFASGKKAGKQQVENEVMRDAQERVERGRQAVREAGDAFDPEQLRRNDDKW